MRQTITSMILELAHVPVTIKQISDTLKAKQDNIRILVSRLAARGEIKRIGVDQNHCISGTQPFLWITTNEDERIAILQAKAETQPPMARIRRTPAAQRTQRIQPSRTSIQAQQAHLMIAGSIHFADKCAAHIAERIAKASTTNRWFVWVTDGVVNYCSSASSVIFDESNLVGTYTKRVHVNLKDIIADDINAAKEDMGMMG